jgi:hypothetical protein
MRKHDLDSVQSQDVAKRERDPYRPGDRGWVKAKNRATARFAEERDGVGRRSRALA